MELALHRFDALPGDAKTESESAAVNAALLEWMKEAFDRAGGKSTAFVLNI